VSIRVKGDRLKRLLIDAEDGLNEGPLARIIAVDEAIEPNRDEKCLIDGGGAEASCWSLVIS
jgi:hypothetical protein